MNQDHMESLVDSDGVVGVLALLGAVCDDKANHIRENWQDEGLAKEWERAGTAIGFLVRKLSGSVPGIKCR